MDNKITITKETHQGYWSKERAKKIGISQIFGKWQYRYISKKGKISLILLLDYWRTGENMWEILCYQGALFEDVERFDTKEDAIKRIEKLLK